MSKTIVERVNDPVEQRHREHLLRAIMQKDNCAVQAALLAVQSADILRNLVFIVRRLQSDSLLSLVHARIEKLCAFNVRVE